MVLELRKISITCLAREINFASSIILFQAALFG